MRPYPTALDVPNRRQRKAQRKTIFLENKLDGAVRRKARREARKKGEQK